MPELKGRLRAESRKFSEVVSDLRHVVFSVVRERPNLTGTFDSVALGTGFFLKSDIFITCDHVMNPAADPHRDGDSYKLIANLTGSSATVHAIRVPEVGKDLTLFPNLDLAILRVPNSSDQAYAAIQYDEVEMGDEIGIVGYPLPQLGTDANGHLLLEGLIYRCGKGVVTGRHEATINTAAPNLPMIEANFMFVSGNSGGPVFCPDTGVVLGMVQGIILQKIADYPCLLSPGMQAPLGLPALYVTGVLAIYSGGIKLDAFRAALEDFGVTP